MTVTPKSAALLLAVAAATAVSGCAGLRQAVGAEKVAPDEFKVVTKAPLVVPPDFALRPPRPGDARPQELRADTAARAAVFGQDIGKGASEGERALVAMAGADAVNPAIRAQVDLESGAVVRKSEALANQVISPAAAPAAGDAEAEAKRLAEQEAIRRSTGGAPVVIERRESRTKLPGL
jgi:hypothetical protein